MEGRLINTLKAISLLWNVVAGCGSCALSLASTDSL